MQTVKKQDWIEFSWRNNVYIAKFNLKTRFMVWHRIHVFPMIITVCAQLSLLQLITRFKLHVLKQCRLTVLSWGSID